MVANGNIVSKLEKCGKVEFLKTFKADLKRIFFDILKENLFSPLCAIVKYIANGNLTFYSRTPRANNLSAG